MTANPALRETELRYVLEQSRSAGLFHTAAFRGSDMGAIAVTASAGLAELRTRFCFDDWQTEVRGHEGTAELPEVKALMMAKLALNSALHSQGVANSGMISTVFDGISRHTREGYAFQLRAGTAGFREAVRERDKPYGDHKRGQKR